MPNIGYAPVNEHRPNIARVVCDFGLMDFRELNYLLEGFGYDFTVKQKIGAFKSCIIGNINNIFETSP